MLSEDPQLAKEVEFDMKRFEREQQEQSQLPTSNLNISKQNVRFIFVFVLDQGSENCSPQSRNLRPASSFTIKNVKFNNNDFFLKKTYS